MYEDKTNMSSKSVKNLNAFFKTLCHIKTSSGMTPHPPKLSYKCFRSRGSGKIQILPFGRSDLGCINPRIRI